MRLILSLKALYIAGFLAVFSYLNSYAQFLYGGSFQRQPSVTLSGTDFAYRMVCKFYADEAGKNALPPQLRFKIIRKRDHQIVGEFWGQKSSEVHQKTIFNECASANTSTQFTYFTVSYEYERIINPIEFSDNEGYYVVNEAPPVPRKATANIASPKLVLYHWFSPAYIFHQLDNADQGRATSSLDGEYSYICRNEGRVIPLHLTVWPSVRVFDPRALDLSARTAVPLTEGGLPFAETEWKAGFSPVKPIGEDLFVSNSKPKFDNNSENSQFQAWTVPTQDGLYSMAFVSEQRLNGVKLAENSLEMFAEVGECVRGGGVSLRITQVGSNQPANPYFCIDKPIQLNAVSSERGLTYQWYKEGSPIPNATNSTLQITETGRYFLRAKKEGVCGESTTPTIKAIAIDCQSKGDPAILGNNMYDLTNWAGETPTGYINDHGFRAVFYIPMADLPKMPTVLKASIYRKSDNTRMDELVMRQNYFANETNTIERLCDNGLDTVFQVVYDASIEFSNRYNDPQGYYVATEPLCCRADADNLGRRGSSVVAYMEVGPANQVKSHSTILRGHSVDLMLPFTMRACVGQPVRVFAYTGNRENITASFGGFAELVSGGEPNPTFRQLAWAPGFTAENFTGNQTRFTVTPRRNGIIVMEGTPEKPGVFVYRLRIDGLSNGKVYSSVFQEFRLVVDDCTPPPTPAIVVSKVGKPNLIAPTELCQDSLVQLNLKNFRSWGKLQWFFNGRPVANATDSVMVIARNQMGDYTCRIQMPRQCPEFITTAPLKITFRPRPVVNVKAAKDYFCEGQKVQLEVIASTAQSLEWLRNDVAIDKENAKLLTVKEVGIYQAKGTDAVGCPGFSAPVSIMQRPLPTAKIQTPATQFCEGQSLSLSAQTNAEKPQFEWQWENSALPNSNRSTYVAQRAGVYALKITDAYGCISEIATEKLIVNPLPQAVINAPKDFFCEGKSLNISANVSEGYGYEWFLNGQSLQIFTPELEAKTVGNYSVKVTSAQHCSQTSTPKTIHSVKNPIVTIAASRTRFCAGTMLPLTASGSQLQTFYWTKDGVKIPSETQSHFLAKETGNYSVTATDVNGCEAASAPLKVEAVEAVRVKIDSIAEFCGIAHEALKLNGSPAGGIFEGQGVRNGYFSPRTAGLGLHTITYTVKNELECLSGIARQTVRVRAAPSLSLGKEREIFRGSTTRLHADMGAGYTYTWTPATWIDDAKSARPRIAPDSTTYYRVIALSPDNCASEDSIRIIVVQRVFMPEVFTPNGDGHNDTWQIIGREAYPEIEVTIYNRWGNAVYYAKGNNQPPFDGTYDGQPLPEGVYIYVVRAKPDGHIDRGQVMISR
ncbi:MAG: gliding motility-associated C-terminal domain-containing protein [Runella sp.]